MATKIDDYNEDELDAPEWMNTEFFATVLRESEHDAAIEVKELKLSPATIKGDHYASVMFRASVEYQQKAVKKTKSLIIKTMPEVEGVKKEFLGDTHIFETEIGMYTEVLPHFEKILRSVGDETVLKAHCLYHSLTPKQVMVFEDVVPLGYTVLRDRQVSLEEAKGAFSKLAKWHAISYKLIKEDPTCFDQYRHGFMAVPSIRDNDVIAGGIKKFIDMLHTVPDFKKYIPHFEAINVNLFDKCIAEFTEYFENPQDGAMYVLCHGDFHLKNMMFKQSPKIGEFQDVMLIDFQMSYVGPIVNDLMYGMYMLIDSDIRKNHSDELLQNYFTSFVEILKKTGYKEETPELTRFLEQFVRYKYFDIFLIVTFLPMWYVLRDVKIDPADLISSDDARKSLYHNPEYIDELKVILPKYLKLGYLGN